MFHWKKDDISADDVLVIVAVIGAGLSAAATAYFRFRKETT